MLRRRLAFDPGDRGRGPGDTWRGEDIRVVDGKPVEVAFESRAVAWEQVFGIRTLRVKSTLTGAGYSCEEDVWLHPATAIPIRWVRNAKYAIETPSGDDVWADETQGALVSVSGVD